MYASYFLEAAQYVSWADEHTTRPNADLSRDIAHHTWRYVDANSPPPCPHPVIIVSRVSLIAADIIVLGVTWAATHEAYRSQDLLRRLGRTTTLSSVLYTNGAAFDFLPRASQISGLICGCDRSAGAIYFV